MKTKFGDKRRIINQKLFIWQKIQNDFHLKNRYILDQRDHTTEVSRKQLFNVSIFKHEIIEEKISVLGLMHDVVTCLAKKRY